LKAKQKFFEKNVQATKVMKMRK